MTRRTLLLFTTLVVMLAIAALGSQQKKPTLLVLEWAAKAAPEQPPLAVLIELGIKDTEPTPGAGRATVTGAKVAHREGYRFRDGDKLTGTDAWQASSRRGLRVPARQPAVSRMEGIATVGIVLH